MIKDHIYKESDGKKVLEVLIEDMWIPVMGMDLRSMGRDYELRKVKEIRVRDFEYEK